MAFRRAIPDASAIVRNQSQLADFIRDIHDRVAKLERRTSTEAVSTEQRAPVSAKPKMAGVSLTGAQGKGRWNLTIRNPEFGNTAGTGKVTPKPLYHRVSYSADPNFKTGVTTLDPSPQTHFSIADEPHQTLHVRVESSHDGVTWNLPQYKKAQG
jgi:hypothetical protein